MQCILAKPVDKCLNWPMGLRIACAVPARCLLLCRSEPEQNTKGMDYHETSIVVSNPVDGISKHSVVISQ